MCWSATADLVAGAGIATIGVVCVARVRRARDLPLAALPLLLGAHQIVESVVWRSGGGSGPATLAWAVIALPLPPVWVPLGVLLAAPARVRRRLVVPALAGFVTAAALAYCLATRTVTADVRGHTVGYALDVPYAPWSSWATSSPPSAPCCWAVIRRYGCWAWSWRAARSSARRCGAWSSSPPGAPSRPWRPSSCSYGYEGAGPVLPHAAPNDASDLLRFDRGPASARRGSSPRHVNTPGESPVPLCVPRICSAVRGLPRQVPPAPRPRGPAHE